MTLSERLNTATTSTNKWNSWPDLFDIILTDTYDLSSPKEAYEAGKLIGNFDAYRQIKRGAFPVELQTFLPRYDLIYTYFRLSYSAGQQDDESRRNILAMWETCGRWVECNDKVNRFLPIEPTYPYTHLIVATIGCKHDYDTTGSRMCLSRGKCRKCGHTFLCDSGD